MMKRILFLLLVALCFGSVCAQTETVVIQGRVTDYDGRPIDSVSVLWQNERFQTVVQAWTNAQGQYSARVPRGKYHSVAAIHLPSYLYLARPEVAQADQRLVFWAWDFVADRDTTLHFSYHRMEAYGLRVFHIPGTGGKGRQSTYRIYVRPMSLTRFFDWKQKGEPKKRSWAPEPDQLKAGVWIDGKKAVLVQIQPVSEFVDPIVSLDGYVLTVIRPETEASTAPYRVFKVELTDLQNGDRGEGLYYMDKERYVK